MAANERSKLADLLQKVVEKTCCFLIFVVRGVLVDSEGLFRSDAPGNLAHHRPKDLNQ
jgi:hypothetical protein